VFCSNACKVWRADIQFGLRRACLLSEERKRKNLRIGQNKLKPIELIVRTWYLVFPYYSISEKVLSRELVTDDNRYKNPIWYEQLTLKQSQGIFWAKSCLIKRYVLLTAVEPVRQRQRRGDLGSKLEGNDMSAVKVRGLIMMRSRSAVSVS